MNSYRPTGETVVRTSKINAVLSGEEVGTFIVHWADGRTTIVAGPGYMGTEKLASITESVREWWKVNGYIGI